MLKRGRIIFVILVLAILFGLVWSGGRQSGPTYGGTPLRYWLEMLADTSPGADPPASWQDLGPDELPVMIKALEMRESPTDRTCQKVVAFLWPKLPFSITRHLPHPLDTETMAINVLLLMDQEKYVSLSKQAQARSAISVLLRMMKNDRAGELRSLATYKLGEIGRNDPTAKAALTDALKDTDPTVRMRVTEALRSFSTRNGEKAASK